ncbi:hypothetical protein BBR01nite_01090 [Brevibacillus brevis]|nr:hypothetical protein BBR01nite_01090 [Brevibacillus brevis]
MGSHVSSQVGRVDFLFGNDIGVQVVLPFFIWTGKDNGRFYPFMLQKFCFDLTQFDPVASDFDLMVDASEIFHVAAG